MSFLARWYLGTLASAAVTLGMKKRALELYREIVASDPTDTAARSTVGNMLMEAGDRAGALQEFRQLVEIAPSDSDAWFNLAFIREQCEDLDGAEQSFRRSIQLNDQQDRAWYGLALVLIRQERLREAVDALKKNITLQPFSPYGYYQLAMTQHHLGDSGDAWRTYEKLKFFEPRYAATLKRDLEQTKPRGPGLVASDSPDPSIKEALTAST